MKNILKMKMWIAALAVSILAVALKNVSIVFSIIYAAIAALLWVIAAKQEELDFSWIKKLGDDTEKFAKDEEYRRKVIRKYERIAEHKHEIEINKARDKVDYLIAERKREISRQINSDWMKSDGLKINKMAGLIKINGSEYLFSSIRGAKINCVNGHRFIENSQNNTVTEEHLSGGGAVLGGIVGGIVGGAKGGALGAAIGAKALGNTTSHEERTVSGRSIATCDYLGVSVDMDGFFLEIPVLKRQTDQSSDEFRDALDQANAMIVTLKALAKMPVADNYMEMVENRQSVLEFDNQISFSEEQLKNTIAKPVEYCLPAKYAPLLAEKNEN